MGPIGGGCIIDNSFSDLCFSLPLFVFSIFIFIHCKFVFKVQSSNKERKIMKSYERKDMPSKLKLKKNYLFLKLR